MSEEQRPNDSPTPVPPPHPSGLPFGSYVEDRRPSTHSKRVRARENVLSVSILFTCYLVTFLLSWAAPLISNDPFAGLVWAVNLGISSLPLLVLTAGVLALCGQRRLAGKLLLASIPLATVNLACFGLIAIN